MSLVQLVADMVTERGSATCDELLESPKLSQHTRDQVMNAMKNARRVGLIHCQKRYFGLASGSEPARHYPGARDKFVPLPKPRPKAERGCAPPASVWELGDRELRPWPPVGEGRKFNLLGPWDAA